MQAETFFLRASDGVRLAVHRMGGPEHGPILVWTHANGFCSHSYQPLLSLLTRWVRVVGVDARGHGQSGKPGEPLERTLALGQLVADYVQVLEALRQAHPGSPLIGAGHSMGALLPLLAAVQGQALERLILVEAAVFPPPGHEAREGAAALTADRVKNIPRRRARFADPVELCGSLQRLPAFASVRPEHLLQHCTASLERQMDGSYALRCPPAVEAFLYDEITRFGSYNELAGLQLPVLLVGADPDHPGSSWVSKIQSFLQQTIPTSRLQVLAGAGHLAPLQAPVEIAQWMEQWIRS